jgi:two-component system, NtrC family, response regulator HydG
MASIRMLLIGAPGGEFRLAAELARQSGADVMMADDAAQALDCLREQGADLAMIDVEADVSSFMASLRAERFPVPVLACGIAASAERAVAAIRAGARDYVPLPPQRDLIAAAIASVIERKAPARIEGHPALARALALAEAVAPSSAPLLVTGEKGSGKETMARTIHELSGRTPLQIAECAGVPADVLESELFGHEAGAFPGAVARRAGRFETAAEGTVLLREVGALTPRLQARLLAVLQEQRFNRVGGAEAVPFRARVIASSSIDLDAAVEAGSFRADLLVRLGLVRIEVPSLRMRGADAAQLGQHFAEQFALADGIASKRFSDTALAVLRRYPWPGNIRELEDCVHRAVLLSRGVEIQAEDLTRVDGKPLLDFDLVETGRIPVESLVGRTVEEVERELILQTLEHCHGNRTSASNILGISVRTMRNKLRIFIEGGIAVPPAA